VKKQLMMGFSYRIVFLLLFPVKNVYPEVKALHCWLHKSLTNTNGLLLTNVKSENSLSIRYLQGFLCIFDHSWHSNKFDLYHK